jgi:hypothetical protein
MSPNPELPVQRQLEAYNARDLDRFALQYAEDVRIYRLPALEPVLVGKAALTQHYATKRFNLPDLHAKVVSRMVLGNKVIDHEHVTGLPDGSFEAAAIYEVVGERIQTVWFIYAQP